MNITDILFIFLVVGLFMYSKKVFKRWVLFLLVSYALLKYFNQTEHMTTEQTVTRLTEIDKDIAYLKSVGLTETSDNDTMKTLVAERDRLKASVPPQSSTVVTPDLTPTPEVTKSERWSPCSI